MTDGSDLSWLRRAPRDGIDPSRIPPGQYYERGFPVLSAGPTPRTPLEGWTFDQIAVDEARSWTWGEYAGQVWAHLGGPPVFVSRFVQTHVRV